MQYITSRRAHVPYRICSFFFWVILESAPVPALCTSSVVISVGQFFCRKRKNKKEHLLCAWSYKEKGMFDSRSSFVLSFTLRRPNILYFPFLSSWVNNSTLLCGSRHLVFPERAKNSQCSSRLESYPFTAFSPFISSADNIPWHFAILCMQVYYGIAWRHTSG